MVKGDDKREKGRAAPGKPHFPKHQHPGKKTNKLLQDITRQNDTIIALLRDIKGSLQLDDPKRAKTNKQSVPAAPQAPAKKVAHKKLREFVQRFDTPGEMPVPVEEGEDVDNYGDVIPAVHSDPKSAEVTEKRVALDDENSIGEENPFAMFGNEK